MPEGNKPSMLRRIGTAAEAGLDKGGILGLALGLGSAALGEVVAQTITVPMAIVGRRQDALKKYEKEMFNPTVEEAKSVCKDDGSNVVNCFKAGPSIVVGMGLNVLNAPKATLDTLTADRARLDRESLTDSGPPNPPT